MFKPFSLLKSTLWLSLFSVKRITSFILFTTSFLGRFDLHKFTIRCNVCNSIYDPFEAVNVVRHGFWPSNCSNVSYLFSNDLFYLWDSFRKNMPGSSMRAFIRSLEDISSLHGRVRRLYVLLFQHYIWIYSFSHCKW